VGLSSRPDRSRPFLPAADLIQLEERRRVDVDIAARQWRESGVYPPLSAEDDYFLALRALNALYLLLALDAYHTPCRVRDWRLHLDWLLIHAWRDAGLEQWRVQEEGRQVDAEDGRNAGNN
jgi:hypothetical protein